MADLHYSPGAYAIVTGGLQKLYPSPLDFNIIDSELWRMTTHSRGFSTTPCEQTTEFDTSWW